MLVPSIKLTARTLAACTLWLGAACASDQSTAAKSGSASTEQALLTRARSTFEALPDAHAMDAAQVALGRRLFFDTRVSSDGQVGCVSCHQPGKWATDGLPLAIGTSGRTNPRNSPTVLNAFLQINEHWRGERQSVEDQAKRALLGPASFGLASDDEAAQKLGTLGYEAAFREAFPNEEPAVSTDHWASAIGAYERTLITKSPFDAYLGGDAQALPDPARAGLAAFLDSGCDDCHDGPLLGGRSFEKFGRYADYVSLTHSDHHDAGRFDVTQDETDRDVFKVAALRNVEQTAPYFHDGSVGSLTDAVRVMGKAQLDLELSAETTAQIVAFLKTLTGPVPETFSASPDGS